MRVPIGDNGTAGTPELVADLTGAQPDGMALAEDGTMFVGCYRPDRIYRIGPDGRDEVWADDADGVVLNQPANVVFQGEHVVVVEDIVDTGLTLHYLTEQLEMRGPASVRVCALLHKPARAKRVVSIDYLGFTIPDVFVVGYGLDWAQRYRNLRDIGTLAPHVYS